MCVRVWTCILPGDVCLRCVREVCVCVYARPLADLVHKQHADSTYPHLTLRIKIKGDMRCGPPLVFRSDLLFKKKLQELKQNYKKMLQVNLKKRVTFMRSDSKLQLIDIISNHHQVPCR